MSPAVEYRYLDSAVPRPAAKVPRLQGWVRNARVRRIALITAVMLLATPAIRISTTWNPVTASPGPDGTVDLSPLVNAELRWLLSSVHPSGALALTPGLQRVVPYFSNIAMLAIVDRAPPVAGNYIDWYLENINLPDKWGMFGTIYDFRVRGDELIPTGDYDSADSYAATFLTLIRRYFQRTGDLDFIRSRQNRIELVAHLVRVLQDKDGLVRVKPRDWTKYLMDNCEDYKGLMDWADMLEDLGDNQAAARYRSSASRIAAAVEYRMWNEQTGSYAWRIDRVNLPGRPAWRKWYPDAVSQLYPAMFGLISPSSSRARLLYEKFNKSFPYWPDVNRRHGFPWGMVAQSSIDLGDYRRAMEFVESARGRYVDNGGPHPWYCLESAMFIMACDRLAGLPGAAKSQANSK